MDGTVDARLNSQTTGMHAAKKSHIEALLDGFEKIHHEVMGDVVTAEGEIVFVVRPTAFHQLGFEPFVLEKALLKRGVDGRLTSQPDKADLDVLVVDDFDTGFLAAASEEKKAQPDDGNEAVWFHRIRRRLKVSTIEQ